MLFHHLNCDNISVQSPRVTMWLQIANRNLPARLGTTRVSSQLCELGTSARASQLGDEARECAEKQRLFEVRYLARANRAVLATFPANTSIATRAAAQQQTRQILSLHIVAYRDQNYQRNIIIISCIMNYHQFKYK